MDTLDKRMIYILGGMEQTGKDFIIQVTVVCSLILINDFWHFPFQIVEPQVTKSMGSKTTDKDVFPLYCREPVEHFS